MSYRVPVLEKFHWQEPVIQVYNVATPITSPNAKDRYIVANIDAGSTFESGFAIGDIAWYDGTAWQKDTPTKGWRVFNKATESYWYFDGIAWQSKLIIGDLEINGNISTVNQATEWSLIDANTSALSIKSATDANMLVFDTINDRIITESQVKIDSGDVDVSQIDTIVTINDGSAGALSFDSDTYSGMLAFNTAAGIVNIGQNLVIAGNLTVQGTTTTVQTNDMIITDKIITLNDGGGAGTAVGSGIEFKEENGITGYMKTNGTGQGFDFKAPAVAGVVTILPTTTDTTLKLFGHLDVESDSKINQDLTTDSTTVRFGALKVDGDIDLTTTAINVDLIATADAISFDTANKFGIIKIDGTNTSEKVYIGVPFDITGVTTFHDDITLENGAVITNSVAGTFGFNDNAGNSVTVHEATISYNHKANYDAVLKTLVFDLTYT